MTTTHRATVKRYIVELEESSHFWLVIDTFDSSVVARDDVMTCTGIARELNKAGA